MKNLKLPAISSEKMIKALEKIGFKIGHQKGSHIVLRKNIQPFSRIVVPRRNTIAKGTIGAIVRQSGLTREEFFDCLKNKKGAFI